MATCRLLATLAMLGYLHPGARPFLGAPVLNPPLKLMET